MLVLFILIFENFTFLIRPFLLESVYIFSQLFEIYFLYVSVIFV